jgi:membrane protein
VLGVILGLLTSTALFLYLFWRLPKVKSPFRRIVRGALLAAVLFEVLKRVGAFYIERTTENPLYGSFAVVVGLLVWINIVSRMLLICAAWTVTAPYDSDIEPSGTASVEAARKAGIPTEFADHDPDDPPNLQEEGAPSPLGAAVQGRTPSQDEPEGRAGSTGAAQAPADRGGRRVEAVKAEGGSSGGGTATLVRPATEPQPGRAEVVVRQAAQFTAGALGMAFMAVLLHVVRTVRDLVLRR